jgi:hypothetical protein
VGPRYRFLGTAVVTVVAADSCTRWAVAACGGDVELVVAWWERG